MNPVNAEFQGRRLSLFLDGVIDFFSALLHHFFNPCRMNTSVYNELFQGNPCNFSPNRVETGKNDRLRCIINNQFHTGKLLQCPDISSLTADDSPLHFIVRKLYYRDGGLRHLVCRTALNRFHDILSCRLLRFFLRSGIIFPNNERRIMLDTVLNGMQKFLPCLLFGKTGNSFQFYNLLRVQRLDFSFFLL